MESAKRGIILVVLLLLVGTAYSVNMHLGLENNRVGPGSVFDGFLKFNFTEALSLSENIIFNSAGTLSSITLEEALSSAGVLDDTEILAEVYDSAGKSGNVHVLNNQIRAGFDLRGSSENPRGPGAVIVEEASFRIRANRGPINNPRIFIGKDLVYQYRGNEIGWRDLERPHLRDLNTNGLSIGISHFGVYCQKMNVSASGKYQIKTIVKKNSETAVGLNVSMIDVEERDITFPLCNERNPCKTISNEDIGTSFGEESAVIEKNIPQTTEQYLCVFPAEPTDELGDLFSIRVNEEGIGNGIISGTLSEWNFYIYGKYRTYNHALNNGGVVNVNINPESLNNYMLGITGCEENCMIIPLNVSFVSGNELTLNDLNLNYLLHGTSNVEEREFSLITLLPESARYDGNVVLDLSSLENVKSPAAMGENYKLNTALSGVLSNEVNFSVVPAPSSFIRYGPFNPGVNEEITFDGTSSRPVENRSILSYIWDFGDGNVKNTATATHFYITPGNYRVKLRVTDSEGISGIDSLIVIVSNVSVSTEDLINETKHAINLFLNNIEGSSQKVADTVDVLGLRTELAGFQTELDSLLLEYNRISANATNASTILTPIRQRVSEILMNVPLGLRADSLTFNGGITGVNQLPTCCEFTTENARNKMFFAQESITVNAEARLVSIEYPEREAESFILIKKDIIGIGAKVYELLPFGLQIRDVFAGGNFTSPAPNVYSFPFTSRLIYTVGSANLVQAIQARTAVLPADLESVGAPEEEADVLIESECGNNLCEADENSESCPDDCGPSNAGMYIVILIAVLVIGLAAYFGFFFRGGFFRNIMHRGARRMFKNERDYHAVGNFILNAMSKNVAKQNIVNALKSKGWKENQINSVFDSIENQKKEAAKKMPAKKH